jgi:hypothetical protein
MGMRALLCAICAACGLACSAAVASAATLVADYQLQDSNASSVPGAPSLDPVGPGVQFVTETVGCTPTRLLSFPEGSGLQLANPTAVNFYSVVVLFRLADLSGYRRIFAPGNPDFNTDNGLYNRDGRLTVYETGSHPGPTVVFADNTYAEVAFTYNAFRVAGYTNGVQQVGYDGAGAQNASQMRFFKDNDSGGVTTEHSAGAVARIRIYNGELTPDEVASIHATSPITGACDPSKNASASINGKVKVKKGPHGRFIVLTGIEVSCPASGAACDGSAKVTRGVKAGRATASKLPKKLGKAKLSVAAGTSKAVKVKLTRKASDALRRKGKLKATISVSLSDSVGSPAVASRPAKLKAPG